MITQLDYSLRRYKPSDKDKIIQLLKLGFDINQSIESWEWLYAKNPFGHFIGVAEYNGQIIGHMALVPTILKVGEKIEEQSQAVGLVVHPAFRRRGIFVALGKYITAEGGKAGMDFSFALPNKPAHRGHLKYGWLTVCYMPNMVKFFNLLHTSMAKKIVRRYHIPDVAARFFSFLALELVNIYAKIRYNIKGMDKPKIKNIKAFDDRIHTFWRQASENYHIIVVRDKRYLNWRYLERPNRKYHVLVAENHRKILGYTVIEILKCKDNVRQGRIVDLLSLNIEAAQNLVLESLKYCRAQNCDSVFCAVLGDKRYLKVLRRNGFLMRGKTPLIVRVNSEDASDEQLRKPENWFITWGDIL